MHVNKKILTSAIKVFMLYSCRLAVQSLIKLQRDSLIISFQFRNENLGDSLPQAQVNKVR